MKSYLVRSWRPFNSGKRDILFMPLFPSEIRASSYGFLHSSPRLDTLTPSTAAKQAFG